MMRIYIDFKSPAAYLAMRPTRALIDKHQLSVSWRAFKTSQAPIPAMRADEDKGATHRRVRAQARRDTHLMYARLQGTPMSFPDPPGETDLALAALHVLDDEPGAYIDLAFAAYWTAHADLNDPKVVARLLEKAGLDAAMLDNLDTPSILAQARHQAEQDGVVDAPAYVIGEQLFVGREHLPWIEEIIGGP